MVEKLFEKFFEFTRKLASEDDKLKYAVIDNEAGVAVVEYGTILKIDVKLVIHKPDNNNYIYTDIVLPVPGVNSCAVVSKVKTSISCDTFIDTAAAEVLRAAFNLALESSRTIPRIVQYDTAAKESDNTEQSDYDKAVDKLVTALSMKYRFVKLVGSDDYTTHVFEDTDTYYSYSQSAKERVRLSVRSEYDDGQLLATIKVYGPDMPDRCLYKEVVITPGEDEETGIILAVTTISDLVDCLRPILGYVRPMK